MGDANLEHGAIQLFRLAQDCDHPEPDEETSEWEDWEEDHQPGGEGDVICMLTPEGTGCPACTEKEADERDLPEGEYVPCRLPVAVNGDA